MAGEVDGPPGEGPSWCWSPGHSLLLLVFLASGLAPVLQEQRFKLWKKASTTKTNSPTTFDHMTDDHWATHAGTDPEAVT